MAGNFVFDGKPDGKRKSALDAACPDGKKQVGTKQKKEHRSVPKKLIGIFYEREKKRHDCTREKDGLFYKYAIGKEVMPTAHDRSRKLKIKGL
jgi:hypothetical protein